MTWSPRFFEEWLVQPKIDAITETLVNRQPVDSLDMAPLGTQ